MNKRAYLFWIASGVVLYCIAKTTVCQAQITSDGTLSSEVTTSDNLNFTITGGSQATGNLFHSFSEFSVPTGGSATFDNALDVQNIVSRVTGSSISNIDGLLRARGSANLFMINPNGIIFSSNAQLDIGGSFLATTANRLNFADGKFFSATAPQTTPLLTISVPIGLQFGETAARIVNQSAVLDSDSMPVGLQVQPGRTLALVGGDVFVERGFAIAPEGRIELGSVSSNSFVSLTPIAEGWTLGYDSVQNFRDIHISQTAFVSTSQPGTGTGSGTMQLQSRRLTITDSTQVGGENSGANPGGTIAIKASEFVEVSNGGYLVNTTFGNGKAGDTAIETRRLLVRNGGFINASTSSFGQGGNLTINAFDSVEVIEGLIFTQAFATGNAGKLQITTGNLILREGGQIATSTSDAGNGGALKVDASKSVEVSGQSVYGTTSGLFAQSHNDAAGNGGSLQVNTERLVVWDGGRISVSAVESSTGQAGNLDINASKSIEVNGIGSTVLAESNSPKPAGNLTINTDKLAVRNGAEVTVSSEGTGNAGNLEVTASSIRLDNAGKLTATSTSGEGGNIRLNDLDLLLLRGNSEISTSADGIRKGGNIDIDADLLIGLDNSDITANAFEGEGGFIQITTKGIFGLRVSEEPTENSDITAFSEKDPSLNGVVEINRLDIDPSADLVILPADPVDISGLIAQGCSAGNVANSLSEFVITGRGGLPPIPEEATRSDSALADLGTPVQTKDNRATAAISSNFTSASPAPLIEAQGWVIGSQGEVILTTQAPSVTIDVPWLKPTSCNAS